MLAPIQNPIPVVNGAVPCEGTKALPFNLDFSADNAFDINLTSQQQGGQFSTLQTIYAQNMSATEPLIFFMEGSQQLMSLPPEFAGYIPIICPVPFRLQVRCADNTNTAQNIQLLNFYLPPLIWDVS